MFLLFVGADAGGNEEGETIESMVVTTLLSSGVQAESMGHRMADAASEVRRIALALAD